MASPKKPSARAKTAHKALPAIQGQTAPKKRTTAKPEAPVKAPAPAPSPQRPKRQPRGAAVPTSGEKIMAAERRNQAMQLRIHGATFKEIGRAMGVTEQRAHQLVSEGVAHQSLYLAETANELIVIEAARLERLYAMAYRRATFQPPSPAGPDPHRPPPEMDYEAARLCVRISERRSKLLGLDRPTRLDLGTPEGAVFTSPVVIEVIGVEASIEAVEPQGG